MPSLNGEQFGGYHVDEAQARQRMASGEAPHDVSEPAPPMSDDEAEQAYQQHKDRMHSDPDYRANQGESNAYERHYQGMRQEARGEYAQRMQGAYRGKGGGAGFGRVKSSRVPPGQGANIPGPTTGAPRTEGSFPGSTESEHQANSQTKINDAHGRNLGDQVRTQKMNFERAQMHQAFGHGTEDQPRTNIQGQAQGGPGARLRTNLHVAMHPGKYPMHASGLANNFVRNLIRTRTLMARGGWVEAVRGMHDREPLIPYGRSIHDIYGFGQTGREQQRPGV